MRKRSEHDEDVIRAPIGRFTWRERRVTDAIKRHLQALERRALISIGGAFGLSGATEAMVRRRRCSFPKAVREERGGGGRSAEVGQGRSECAPPTSRPTRALSRAAGAR